MDFLMKKGFYLKLTRDQEADKILPIFHKFIVMLVDCYDNNFKLDKEHWKHLKLPIIDQLTI